MSAALAAEGLNTFYGKSHILARRQPCLTMVMSSIRDLPVSWQPMRRGSSRLLAPAPKNGNSRTKTANACRLELSLSFWDRARTWRTFR